MTTCGDVVFHLLAGDPEELDMYKGFKSTGHSHTTFNFEVCDSILNIGPISDITVAQPAFLSVSPYLT